MHLCGGRTPPALYVRGRNKISVPPTAFALEHLPLAAQVAALASCRQPAGVLQNNDSAIEMISTDRLPAGGRAACGRQAISWRHIECADGDLP